MIQLDTTIAQIHDLLEANVDQAYLVKIRELVPSDKAIIGVRVPVIKQLATSYHKSHALTYDVTVALLDQLFPRQIRDEVLFGLFLLEKHKRHFSTALFANIEDWTGYVENWEVCDQLATKITGEVVVKDLSLVEPLLTWTQSENLWRRRSALAVAVSLNQRGRSHVTETLQLTENVMLDDEVMVQKAIGWTLREASKHDEQQVFNFLMRWKDKVRARIIKDSAEKLSPELQQKLLG